MSDGTLLDSQAAPPSATPTDPAAAAPTAPATDPASPSAAPAATADKPQGPPEAYAPFTAPEGVVLDEATTTEFQALAKEHGLTQEAAQKFFELGAKQQAKWAESLLTKTTEIQTKWAEDAKADKEFGGEKLAENLSLAKKAMDAFASPELKLLLGQRSDENPLGTSLGNHPEVIRLFLHMGRAMSDDKFIPGGDPGGANKSPHFTYPKSNHK